MRITYNEACGMGCSTLAQDLVLCEKAGFAGIEIRIDMLRTYLETRTAAELEAFFASNRLRPGPFDALYVYPEFLSGRDDPQKQAGLLADFRLACETGARIGSNAVVVVPPLHRGPKEGPFTGSRGETFANCVRILSRLAEIGHPYGMRLCFEPVGLDRCSVRTLAEADAIVRAVGRPDVGFAADSVNLFFCGGNDAFPALRTVQPEKIFIAHLMNVDDLPERERAQSRRRFCGSGAVDTDLFLTELKRTGYAGMVSVETFRPEYWRQTPEWVIRTAYDTTRAALEKNGCL